MPETFEAPSRHLVDDRQAAFARLVARVIDSLNLAVGTRVEQGITKTEIAAKIGCNRSSLSRALNGEGRNLTLRTISDVLWACDYEPEEFSASPLEDIYAAKGRIEHFWRRPASRRPNQSPLLIEEIDFSSAEPSSSNTQTRLLVSTRKSMALSR